jgi:hypothetical protein
MADDVKTKRRVNRKHVLEALHDETGGWGGDAAKDRVKDYCEDPESAERTEFAYVGALTLQRFYIDPAKPNSAERSFLWKNIMDRLEKEARDPGGWDKDTNVSQLQAIAEEA